MQYEYGGGPTDEEKKKKLGLGIGGSLGVSAPTKPAPTQSVSSFRTPAKAVSRPAAPAWIPTKKVAGNQPKSALTDYFKLVQANGKEAVDQRVKDCTSLWRRYFKPYDGPGVVWSMVNSPLSIEELDKLGKQGQSVVFNYNKENKQNYLTPEAADNTKDSLLIGAFAGVGAVGKRTYTPYTGNAVSPVGLTATREKSRDEWQKEWLSKNKLSSVVDLQEVTGIKLSNFKTYAEFKKATEQWKDKQRDPLVIEKYDQANRNSTLEYQEWAHENHGKELAAMSWAGAGQVVAGVGTGLMLAYPLSLVGGGATGLSGIGARWAARSLFGKLAAVGSAGFIGSNIAGMAVNPEEKAAKVAEEKRQQYETTIKTLGQRRTADMLAMVSQMDEIGDRASLKTLQEKLQEPLLDEEGIVVRVPLGQGLIADGLLTEEWKAVIEQASDAEMRAAADMQQMLIMGGYADKDLEITGAFDKWDSEAEAYVPDKPWQDALEQAQKDWSSQQKLAEDHPALFYFLKTSGLPMSWDGLKALATKMTNEGYAYAPLKALAQSGYYVGGITMAIPAVLEYKVKMDKNPERKKLQKQLVDIVLANLPAQRDDIPFDVDADSLSPGKAQYLVENGNVSNPDAGAIVKRLNQLEANLLQEDSAGWVGLFGYATKDYDSFKQWAADNYDQWHAINMTVDIVGQMSAGRILRLAGSGVGRTAEKLASNHKFQTTLNRIVKLSNKGEFGYVAELVGGTRAAEYAKSVAEHRYGKDLYTKDAPVVVEKATEIVRAARDGNKEAVIASLGEFGKTKEGVAYAGKIIKRARKQDVVDYVEVPVVEESVPVKRVKDVEEKPWVEAEPPVEREVRAPRTLEEIVGNGLIYRQLGKGDVWGTRDVSAYATSLLYDMWSGADGTYYDVLPTFVAPGIKGKSYARISLERAIAGMENKRMQALASAMILPFYRGATLSAYSPQLADFANRVADWVGAVTNDVSMVNRWRTKTVLTDFSRPRAAQRFEAELQALRGEYLNAPKGKQTLAREFSLELVPPDVRGATDQLTGLKMGGGEKGEAQFVRGPGGEEVIMQTSQQKYNIALGRDVMLANVKGKDGTSAWTIATNVGRTAERGLTSISTPMRIVSVGAGAFVLAQKHIFADTGRTLVSEGAGALRLKHNRKRFEEIVNGLPPEAVDRVLFERKVAIENEQHYQLDGGIEATRQARKAFNDHGRPKNMSAAIDTVRRIVTDEGYRAYSTGGEAGLRAWIETPAGQKWLATSGQIRATRNALKAGGERIPGQSLKEVAAADYLARKLELFADYESLPMLNRAMKEMAAGRAPRHDSDIKRAIMDSFEKGRENPTVDVPIETGNGFVNLFARMTKAAMTPNRINREMVFDKVFNDVYGNLTKKQGVPEGDAAMIASTIARTRTNQAHFDLSQGMRFEMKHRWFAWFGTKHRLWNTWLATAAIKHPGYAAAFHEYVQWMEDRNQDESIPEWEKHNIIFTVAGKKFSINLAPYAWLMDYAIESPFGNLAEQGLLGSINKIAGTDLQPAPDAFGFSLSRFDPMAKSVWRLIFSPDDDADKSEWLKFINDLPEKEREKFSEQVTTVWALSGGKKSIADCEKEVLMGNIKHEAYRFLKPASAKMYSEDQTDLFEAKVQYEKVAGTPAASDFLKANPEFAMTIGAGYRDPYAQQELNAALSVYANIKDRYQAAVVQASKDGSLIDPNFANNLYAQEQVELEKLRADVPVFDSWMKGTGEDKTFGQIAHYAFPSITEKEWEEAEIPSEDDQKIYREKLEKNFEDVCKAYDVLPGSTSAVVKMLKHNLVEIPMSDYTKILPSDISIAVKENSRLLYSGDVFGPYRSTAYVETMTNINKRNILLSGTRLAKPDVNNLLMMMLHPAEKNYIGWATDEAASTLWLQYGIRRAQIDRATALLDKTSSTKMRKEMMAELDYEVESTWLPQSKVFSAEWQFSHMRLDERMAMIGYGTGRDKASQGWGDCLDIIGEYFGDLEKTVSKSTGKMGVGPQSGSAAPVARAALKKLVALSKSNPDWFTEWRHLKLGASKFGIFGRWRLEDQSDWELWDKDEAVDESEFIDVYGEE